MRTKVPATVHCTPPPAPADAPQQSGLARIRARGVLRVGYLPDNLPFAYFNAAGELVGLDVEMAHTLARDLRVGLEFVPIERWRMAEQLTAGDCDIMMSGVVVTPERAEVMAFSAPYLEQTVALLVKDHRCDEFSSRAFDAYACCLIRQLDCSSPCRALSEGGGSGNPAQPLLPTPQSRRDAHRGL